MLLRTIFRRVNERADLAITTDYRTVLAEVLRKRMGVKKPEDLFPGWTAANELGLCT